MESQPGDGALAVRSIRLCQCLGSAALVPHTPQALSLVGRE